MEIRHRFLPFHTRLERSEGVRSSDSKSDVGKIHENEIVVDVGGRCRGHDGETLWVLDHHFRREEGNFPSAAAAVLHHAPAIVGAFQGMEEVWIGTHAYPDFDAYCASYLVRALLSGHLASDKEGWEALGLHPGGWFDIPPQDDKRGVRRIDWFNPRVEQENDRRWAVLLAAYSSCVDHGKPTRCDRSRSLHAVLYAAMVRGRKLHDDGAAEIFDRAREAIEEEHLNPLLDSLFDPQGEFAPELELLALEKERYARDLLRSRRAMVTVPVPDKPFDEWFAPLSDQAKVTPPPALIGEPGVDLRINPDHRASIPVDGYRTFDAIYLRDPESLLFKEWARQDHENSDMEAGFTFTAIAYSNRKMDAKRGNTTDYYFSLDPEKADGAHLYHFWLELQCAEIEARAKAGQTSPDSEGPRENFKNRAGTLGGWFHDPWFDGHNYQATIIPSPTDGTALTAGRRADLGDDPVAQIAQRVLEYGIFAAETEGTESQATVVDFSCAPALAGKQQTRKVPVRNAVDDEIQSDCLRFVTAVLRPGIDADNLGVAEKIGSLLWPFLVGKGVRGVPADFREQHLYLHSKHVIVWNRRGAALARLADDDEHVEKPLGEDLRNLANLIGRIRGLVESHNREPHTPHELIEDGQAILRDLATLRLRAAAPEKRAFREILNRSGCDESFSIVHALNVRAAEEEEKGRDKNLQFTVSGVFFLLGVPSFFLSVVGAIGKDALLHSLTKMPGWFGDVAHHLGLYETGPWGHFIVVWTLGSLLGGAVLWFIWSKVLSFWGKVRSYREAEKQPQKPSGVFSRMLHFLRGLKNRGLSGKLGEKS